MQKLCDFPLSKKNSFWRNYSQYNSNSERKRHVFSIDYRILGSEPAVGVDYSDSCNANKHLEDNFFFNMIQIPGSSKEC